ncbi:unnamed protein product [Cylicocyclus nassatus]|uniref:WH2 domain-containing protein n=1 Tax=Cylicocyclus nassatus TaxID=53992 RepID=A0AA36GSV5_CYLNA|nr:unnamed protein product [Cylicocyclus nassatus]
MTKNRVQANKYRYSSAGTNRPVQNVPQSSDDDERARARLRIEQEANDLKRKEQELRGTIGYSIAKDSTLLASTSRLHNDQYRRNNFVPSTLPKNYHNRISSDGNNNAFGVQKSSGNLYHNRQPAPIPQAARQFQPSPVPKTVNPNYARETWNGTLHSSLISLKANNDEAMRIESSPAPSPKPSPQPNRMSPLPEGEITQPVNPGANLIPPMTHRAPSAPNLSENNNVSKFSPSMVKKNVSPFEEKRESKDMAPLTPNAGSNIRKVKEAVKQQSLSQKTAANLLLQKQTTTHTPLNQVTKAFDKDRIEANNNKPKESPKLGRSNNMDSASTVSEDEISNNIAKVLKEGLSTLKKTAPPVEKSGITLGRVVETNRVDDSSRTRHDGGVGQQTRPYASASIPTHSTKPTPAEPAFAPPPPAPAPPPPAPAPPAPPPPPPANLMAPKTQRISSQPPSSQRGLENQRTRSAPTMNGPRAAMPDVRDSLMAEIRNAGGIRALRKVPRQH